MELFNNNLNWYKGNLHTHTTLSDGKVGVDECIELYKKAHYDFLAITDHNKIFKGKDEKLLLLDSIEYDRNDFKTKRAYHITGIAIEEDPMVEKAYTPQEIIDAIKRKNGLAIIAHPAWSLLTHEDVFNLNNYTGMEVWNSVSETDSCRGDSSNYIDVLASKGVVPLIFAVDDTHFYRKDLFGGYILVNSRSLDRESILENIRRGNFYCSQGPEIKQIYVEEGIIRVKTSPVSEIRFISDTFYSPDRISKREGEVVSEGEYKIRPTDTVVRIECVDAQGKKAWSQFIKLDC